jgi:hypothetical protein
LVVKGSDVFLGVGTETEDGMYISYLELSEIRSGLIRNRFTVNVSEARVDSVAADAEIFVRLNEGGTMQRSLAEAKEIAAEVDWTMALEAQSLTSEATDAIVRRLVARKIAGSEL